MKPNLHDDGVSHRTPKLGPLVTELHTHLARVSKKLKDDPGEVATDPPSVSWQINDHGERLPHPRLPRAETIRMPSSLM